MNTQNQTSTSDLKTKITEHIEQLARETDNARVSKEMLHYLDMCSRFHQYSPFNVWLILMEKPDATMVAGFHRWITMKRFVCKGERGITILAPVLIPEQNDDGIQIEKLVGFKTVYVFDISQTDGEPLPEPPNWKSPEKNAELMNKLTRLAQDKGIQIQVKHIGRDIQGVSIGGKIIVDPEAGTKTLIHEIAHELLHHKENVLTDRTTRELEAESVAYVVGKHFGLDSLTSPNYNALHGASADLILGHLERIRNTSAEIIQALEVEDISTI